jgi:hypothetical protein
MLKSKLKCVRHVFVFNNDAEVLWYPSSPDGKQHQIFTVSFKLKTSYGGKSVSKQIKGPASAKCSLHHLKLVLQDNPSE